MDATELTAEECLKYMELIKGEEDWLEKHGPFTLTCVGLVIGCIGGVLTYFLRSRCSEIRCLGLFCKRQVLDIDIEQANVSTTQAS
jgi:hypothetical protein